MVAVETILQPQANNSETAGRIVLPSLVLIAPLLNQLGWLSYPLISAEVFILFALIVAVGLPTGAAATWGGTIARFIVFWPLLTLFVKFEFSSIEIELIGVATLLVLWMLGEHVGKVLATGFTTVIVATLLLPPETSYGHQIAQSSGTNADVAPILHVVLDEHIGLAGLPTEIEPIKLLKEELEDFYREFSFRVYEKAYSQYSWTHNSMSNLFNFSEIDVDSSYFATSRGPFQLRRNEYFRHLTQQGYSIRVYQPVWMQYCEAENANITSCSTYPNFFWGGLADKKLAATEKARLIAGGLLSPVGSLRWAYKNYNKIRGSTSRFGFKLPAWPEWWRSGPLSAFDAFDDLKQDISSGTRGYAFFAHLELPHSPYILDRHCQPYPRVSDWLGPMVDDPLAPENSGDTRAERYRLYAEQIRCQQLLLRDLLEIFLAATKNTESIIVIHGDHGSRITRRQMVAKERALLSRDDFVDSFSTLFATRVPPDPGGLDDRMLPLQALLAQLLTRNHPPVREPTVFLRGRSGETMIEMAMSPL